MKAVFADTSFFLASLNPDDQLHHEELQAALTHDQHFEQAGYKALLR